MKKEEEMDDKFGHQLFLWVLGPINLEGLIR